MLSQKEAVYNAINEVLQEDFNTEEKVTLTTEQRKEVANQIANQIMEKEVAFSEQATVKYNTLDKIVRYCQSLITNHLKKDIRLNGGVKYVPANPGSRTGSQDPVIKTLNQFIKSLDENDERIAVAQEEIDRRKAEIEAEKKKQQIQVDFSLLPTELQEKLSIEEEQVA